MCAYVYVHIDNTFRKQYTTLSLVNVVRSCSDKLFISFDIYLSGINYFSGDGIIGPFVHQSSLSYFLLLLSFFVNVYLV